jgi:tRNA threonylcarbamoyladenosine biosynthesis protein TsaE
MVNEVSLHQLPDFASALASKLTHRIVLLKGDLGAGKTTLVKEMAKALGCKDEVSSPTFGIVNELTFDQNIGYHLDLYRIENPEELAQFGFEEYVNSEGYCFIEWPEIGLAYIPENHHIISIETLNTTTRKITFV